MHFWKPGNLFADKHIAEPDNLLDSAILEILKGSSDEIDEDGDNSVVVIHSQTAHFCE